MFDMKVERVETESNEVRAMELGAQMFEEDRAKARQIWRENARVRYLLSGGEGAEG